MTSVLDQGGYEFLAKLVAACGISGNTQEVSALITSRLKLPHVHLAEDRDGLGVVQATIHSDRSFRVMIQAHMDVVGMRVTYVDERGFCYFRAVGGVDLLAVKGQKVRIHTGSGAIAGLIQGYPIHHTDNEKRDKVPKIDEFYIRTAFTGKAAEKSPILVGDPIVFDATLSDLGEDYLLAPGFDDRLGVFLMTELMRRADPEKLKISLVGVATSGEEIGCRGIRSVAQRIAPHLAIALDVTNATDYPNAQLKKWGAQKMGAGPLLARGYNTRSVYNEKLMELAQELKIPFQVRAEDLTPTDGREIDEAGIPTLVVRIPGSMLHTSHDTVHRRDIDYTFNLLSEFLQRLPLF